MDIGREQEGEKVLLVLVTREKDNGYERYEPSGVHSAKCGMEGRLIDMCTVLCIGRRQAVSSGAYRT
jgi:hypothetical protein